VAAAVSAIIVILMMLNTLIANVMPQKSQHRKDSILAVLDHRRQMKVLKTKARIKKAKTRVSTTRTIELDVRVIPAARSAPDRHPRQAR
jgi:hypothetical protein